MSSGSTSRLFRSKGVLLLPVLATIVLPLATAGFAVAQIYRIPPSVTSIQNHFPPYFPNISPSVTSLGPVGDIGPPVFPVYPGVTGRYGHGFGNRHGDGYKGAYGYSNGAYGHSNGAHGYSNSAYGYSNGTYIAPYYVPVFDPSYGYDTGGGVAAPYLYSGPPPEQTPHVVVDTPAAKHIASDENDGDDPLSAASHSGQDSGPLDAPDATPVDPTVLVFRDGHQQEVSNYAIMGQMVYVFDNRIQKIALGDLDVAATVKANDDRGIEFHIPDAKKS